MLYSFFWVIPRCPNFIRQCFGTVCLFHLHKQCKQKNNQDEIVRAFIWEKVWIENSLSQSVGVGMGRGHVRVEKQAVGGKDPKWMPLVSMSGRNGTVLKWKRRAMGWQRSNYCVSGGCHLSLSMCKEDFQFNGFPDESVHVSGFSRKKCCIL